MARYHNGIWTGNYTLQSKKYDMELQLSFTYSGQIEGNGGDVFGYFTIEGTYSDSPPFSVSFHRRNMDGQGNMEFTGWREREGGGIFGTWKGTQGAGDFYIKPARNQESLSATIQATAKTRQIEQLVSMGFPKHLCEQALQQGTTLEGAVDWLTKTLSGDGHEDPVEQVFTEVDEALVSCVTDMGFSEEQARLALHNTNNDVEAAIEWLVSNS